MLVFFKFLSASKISFLSQFESPYILTTSLVRLPCGGGVKIDCIDLTITFSVEGADNLKICFSTLRIKACFFFVET